MKKLIVASVMGLLMTLGTCAQAQFFRGGKMMRAPKPKIHKSFVRTPKPTQRPGCRVRTMQPPKRIPAGGKAPAVSINGATVERAVAEKVAQQTAAPQASVKPFAGREVYENQADLVRDVHAAYGEQGGEVYLNALNEPFILYTLPEGIVYAPKGRIFSRTLDPKQEFVLYNPATGKGQLIKKHLLRLFKKVTPDTPGSSSLQESRPPLTRVETGEVLQPKQASVEKFVGQEVYTAQGDLAHDVAVFYEGNGVQGKRLQDPFGREYSLYELPQEEIRFQPVGTNTPRVLSAQEYVVIYSMDRNAGELVKKDSPQMRFFQPKVEE